MKLKVIYILKFIFLYILPIFVGFYCLHLYFLCGSNKIYSYKGVSIYTSSNQYSDTIAWKEVIDECDYLLSNQGIKMCNIKIRIFSSWDELEEKKSNSASAGYLPLSHIILLGPVNLNDKKNITRELSGYKSRSIASVLAHEMTHVYQHRKMPLRAFKNDWKLEGQAEFVSNESSFDVDEGLRIFLVDGEEVENIMHGNKYNAVGFSYFRCRLRTDYLIRYKGISYEDFFDTEYDLPTLDHEIRTSLIKGEYIFNSK